MIQFYKWDKGWWIRIFNSPALVCTCERPLFSERYGYTRVLRIYKDWRLKIQS